jgi:hypothetical protein
MVGEFHCICIFDIEELVKRLIITLFNFQFLKVQNQVRLLRLRGVKFSRIFKS